MLQLLQTYKNDYRKQRILPKVKAPALDDVPGLHRVHTESPADDSESV